MKTTICNMIIALLLLASTGNICAQGGGPPMITDDPGTPDPGEWEINVSFDSEIHGQETELESPLLDINYGLNERTQLKIESPYLLTKEEGEPYHGRQSDISLGVKYRFFDEDKYFFSFSMYPAITLSTVKDGYHEYALPVELEKTFGTWVLGAEFGYAYVKDDQDYFLTGLLVGHGFSDKFEAVGEVNLAADRESIENMVETVVNFGIRDKISEVVNLIVSMGTGVTAPHGASKIDFISFAGLQFTI
jgi:hypothetical protein